MGWKSVRVPDTTHKKLQEIAQHQGLPIYKIIAEAYESYLIDNLTREFLIPDSVRAPILASVRSRADHDRG